jgi:hypothetical protein
VNSVLPPTADVQLAFLAKLQRLFAEGDFTATSARNDHSIVLSLTRRSCSSYKFALLIALADLAVELGTDDGRDFTLSTRKIAERFIDLYWKQATPSMEQEGSVLSQAFWRKTLATHKLRSFRRSPHSARQQLRPIRV